MTDNTIAPMPKTTALKSAFDATGQSGLDIISRNICIGARRTSFRIDRLTWAALHDIARRERVTVHELCTAIHAERPRALNFTIAVLRYYMDAATESGHVVAGHGKTGRWH